MQVSHILKSIAIGAASAALVGGLYYATAMQKKADTESPSANVNTAAEAPANSEKSNNTKDKAENKATTPQGKISGTYRCWSYNVSGGSGNCRIAPPIILNTDGTYSMSSEKGTYKIQGSTITLSQSKIRGPGTIVEGNKIRFEYNYNGLQHTITYLKDAGDDGKVSGEEVVVELTLQYDAKDSSLGYIGTVVLVPKGENIETASYQPTAIALYDGEKKITASFFKQTNKVKNGRIYEVYTSSGSENRLVGIIDLTNAKGAVNKIINVSLGIKAEVLVPAPKSSAPKVEKTAPEPEQESAPEPEPILEPSPAPTPEPESAPQPEPEPPSPYAGIPCDPNVPHYSQPGCVD